LCEGADLAGSAEDEIRRTRQQNNTDDGPDGEPPAAPAEEHRQRHQGEYERGGGRLRARKHQHRSHQRECEGEEHGERDAPRTSEETLAEPLDAEHHRNQETGGEPVGRAHRKDELFFLERGQGECRRGREQPRQEKEPDKTGEVPAVAQYHGDEERPHHVKESLKRPEAGGHAVPRPDHRGRREHQIR